jgi:tetratricopeptide (TPR) repeat protein
MKKSIALLLLAMKKLFFFSLVLLSAVKFAHAQQRTADSLKREINRSRQDTAEVVLLNRLSTFYTYSYPDSALQYDEQALRLAQKLDFIVGEIWACNHMGEALGAKGEFANALETDLKALHIAEKEGNKYLTYLTMFYIGGIYNASENYQKSLNYLYKSNAHRKEIKDYKNIEEFMDGLISLNSFRLNKIDSAAYFTYRSYKLDLKRVGAPHWYVPYNFMGDLLAKKGAYKQALNYYRQGLSFAGGNMGRINSYNRLASVYVKTGPADSAIYYSKKSIAQGQSAAIIGEFIEASQTLIDIYQSEHLIDSAFKFQKIKMDAEDSLFSKQKIINFQTVSFKETERDL